jgi:hypothetical protein
VGSIARWHGASEALSACLTSSWDCCGSWAIDFVRSKPAIARDQTITNLLNYKVDRAEFATAKTDIVATTTEAFKKGGDYLSSGQIP